MINKTIKLKSGIAVIIYDKIIDNHNGVPVTKYLVVDNKKGDVFLTLPAEIIKIVNVTNDE